MIRASHGGHERRRSALFIYHSGGKSSASAPNRGPAGKEKWCENMAEMSPKDPEREDKGL